MQNLNTFHFKEAVLNKHSFSPESWAESPDGVEFDMPYVTHNALGSVIRKGTIRVLIPWSSIAFQIKSQHWEGDVS